MVNLIKKLHNNTTNSIYEADWQLIKTSCPESAHFQCTSESAMQRLKKAIIKRKNEEQERTGDSFGVLRFVLDYDSLILSCQLVPKSLTAIKVK